MITLPETYVLERELLRRREITSRLRDRVRRLEAPEIVRRLNRDYVSLTIRRDEFDTIRGALTRVSPINRAELDLLEYLNQHAEKFLSL